MTTDAKATPAKGSAGASNARPKRVTKKDRLVRMLSGKSGADVGSISRKFGWQPHTTRAALTGLRKAGFELSAEQPGEGKPARYRITARPAHVTAATDGEVADAG